MFSCSGVSSLIWSKDADFYALLTGGNVIICSSQTDKQVSNQPQSLSLEIFQTPLESTSQESLQIFPNLEKKIGLH